jgi:hypothetical protein
MSLPGRSCPDADYRGINHAASYSPLIHKYDILSGEEVQAFFLARTLFVKKKSGKVLYGRMNHNE